MIRILHITIGMNRGGIETFIMNVYRKINREKVQFDFLVHTDDECAYDAEIKELGGKIFSIPARNKGILKNRRALNDFFKKHKEYKIVHQHVSSLTYVTPLKIAKKYGIPIRIVHSHSTGQGGSKLHKYLHQYNQLLVNSFATHYFACSEMAAKWLYTDNIINSKKYDIIKNGIDINTFLFNEDIRNKKRKELGIKSQYVIGHVGRFNPVKNHELLIDIFKEVYNKNNNVVLLLVGDGRLKKKIKEKVESLGLINNVIFTGVRTDIPELLQAMDVFVMPSYHEGLPVTLVEAQATGLPCVLSKNITKEVEISNNVKWCDLSDDLSIWASEILSLDALKTRNSKEEEIVEAGYDIRSITRDLEQVYLTK